MICPSASDGPSWTVTIPMKSSVPLMTTGSNPVAVGDDFCHPHEGIRLILFERMKVDPLRRDDDELHEIERVGALAQDLPLRSALAAGGQERRDVLEVAGGDVAGQRLRGGQRLTVAREHVADPALRNGDERHLVNPVLERAQHVPAAAQQLRLEPGLSVQRDEPILHRSRRAPQLLHDADTIVGDVTKRRHKGREHERGNYRQRDDRQIDRHRGPVLLRTRRG